MAAEIPKDSTITVTVQPNNYEAFIMVTPPENGGRDVTREDIEDALHFNNVVFGIREEIIEQILQGGRYSQRLCIAQAKEPVDGVNGEITYRYDKEVVAAPVEDEHGFVDYKDLGLIRTIYKGDVIADITMPTEGEPGTNVRGVPIKQRVGKKATYTIGVNTVLTEDGTQIISKVDGHIICKGNVFSVDTTVSIGGDVDASVGNIDFIGDVVVKGNVCEGFKVSSNANITVNGEVNGATLEAGRDITIKKGCINSNVTAHGSFSAQFCEYSNINCDGDISSQSYVICDVYCGGTLTTKSSNGSIIGGRYVILNSVETANIGSKNYVQTDITLGDNAILAEEKSQLEAQIAKIERSTNDLNLIIDFLNEKKKELHRLPEDKEAILGNAARQRILNGVEIKNAQKRIEEINISLAAKQYLSIGCKGYIYPGTKITINDVTFKADAEYVRSRISLGEDGEIKVSQL